jgi:hypothetical protein
MGWSSNGKTRHLAKRQEDATNKVSKNGNNYLEVYGTMQTAAYEEWADGDRSNPAPDRYAYVTLRFFDKEAEDTRRQGVRVGSLAREGPSSKRPRCGQAQ